MKTKTFGEAFREARKAKRATLREIAGNVGMSIGYLSDIEHNRKNPPDLSVVEKIERFLGVHDHALINLAATFRRLRPSDVTQRIRIKPILSEILLRADECSEEELKSILEQLNNRGGTEKSGS